MLYYVCNLPDLRTIALHLTPLYARLRSPMGISDHPRGGSEKDDIQDTAQVRVCVWGGYARHATERQRCIRLEWACPCWSNQRTRRQGGSPGTMPTWNPLGGCRVLLY